MKNQEKIFEHMKQEGRRLTQARRALLETLAEAELPLSVPEILVALKKKKIEVNKTTVYRELEYLERSGFVHGVQLEDRKRSYELSSDEHHHHLVCLQCHKVEDIDVSEKELIKEEKKVKKEKRFTVLRHSLEFFGLCQHCQMS